MTCSFEKRVVQGTNRHYRLTFTSPDLIDPDTNEEGRVDLTGATVYYRWKKNQSDPNPALISKSSAVATEIEKLTQSGTTLGQADVWLVPADTVLLTPGYHYWDAWVQLADGTRHAAIGPSKVYLVDAVTDLTVPSPAPSGGPGDGDDIAIMERSFAVTHQGAETTEVSLGRVPVGYSIVAVTAEVAAARTAGSLTANVKLNGSTVLTATIDGTNPTYHKDQSPTGTYSADETDEISVEVITASYENAGGTDSTLEVNVAFARVASLSAALNNFTATSNPTVGDDEDDGYAVGSRWINVTLDTGFECRDASAGAAVWTQLGVTAVHALGGGYHTADTLANLNSKITDATLIDTSDSRLHTSGFETRDDSTIAYDDGTRTVTLTPTGASMIVYTWETLHVVSAPIDFVWNDVEGTWYFYLHDVAGVLTPVVTQVYPTDLVGKAMVVTLYWDATNKKVIFFADERHTIVMDGITHQYLHQTQGAQYASGLAPGLTVNADGTLDAHAQVALSEGVIWDEDLAHQILDSVQDITPILNAPVFYRTGAAPGVIRRKTPDTFPFVYSGQEGYSGTRVPYNEESGGSWVFTEAGVGKFLLIHIFASNDVTWPVFAVPGQAVYNTALLARDGALTEMQSLYITGLPAVEFVPICSCILQTGIYTNTPKARWVSANGDDYVEWRGGKLLPGGGVAAVDHGNLIGLLDNDHPQYQLVSEKNAVSGYAGLDGASKLTGSQQVYGTLANTACEGNDARLSDARTPLAHGSSHEVGEADEFNVGGLTGQLASAQTPVTHASWHTNGTDDIQSATAGQKGLMTLAYAGKLDGIEAGADVTDATNVAAAGAAMLAVAQTWTAHQHAQGTTLTSTANQVAITVTADNCYYHDITENSEVQNPGGLAAFMSWRMIVEANGTNNLTWASYYDWGVTGAPDFSTMANGEYLVLDFFAKATDKIACVASDVFGP